jgi:hypothetical protein
MSKKRSPHDAVAHSRGKWTKGLARPLPFPYRRPFAKTLACAALAIVSATAGAEARVLGLATTIAPFSVTATEKAVPLRQNGAKEITFRTTRNNTLVAVTYNAECAVTAGSMLSVRIAVDAVNAQPYSYRDFIMCSSLNQSALNSNAASRQVVIRVPQAGLHTAQVFAVLLSSPIGAIGHLDDTSIVIKD